MILHDANRLGLDYRAEAGGLPYAGPILDAHAHVADVEGAKAFFDAADCYGITRVMSMTYLEHVAPLQQIYGDRLEFICIPNYMAWEQEPTTFTTDWLKRIERFREAGSRMIKFWAAPRGRDMDSDALLLDSPIRRQGMKLAHDLGYRVFMVHVGDPDTWFTAKYTDPRKFGVKSDHYAPLEALLSEYRDVVWIAAHMAGYPEDLDFVAGLLERHANLLLDTSATKWQVRELSKHPPQRVRDFFSHYRHRILFGSDIVASEKSATFDLCASRYWALRTLFETNYHGPSPIVDPDLHMVDPSLDEKSTATLRGVKLDNDVLRAIYHDNTASLLDLLL